VPLPLYCIDAAECLGIARGELIPDAQMFPRSRNPLPLKMGRLQAVGSVFHEPLRSLMFTIWRGFEPFFFLSVFAAT